MNLLRIMALVMFVASGCSAQKPSFPTAKLQGVVSIDGARVKDGMIQFLPEPQTKGQPTTAKIIDGHYTADSVPIGKVRVMFQITRETGRMIKEYSSSYPEVENLVPPAFRDGISISVSGDDQLPFEMVAQSKP